MNGFRILQEKSCSRIFHFQQIYNKFIKLIHLILLLIYHFINSFIHPMILNNTDIVICCMGYYCIMYGIYAHSITDYMQMYTYAEIMEN